MTYSLHHNKCLLRVCCYITAAFLLAACSGIAEEDRLIYEKMPDVQRTVLIEDFTGQRCVNCPNAADKILQLKEQYGEDKIIAVGIHSGPLAVFTRGKVLGLRTLEGDTYYEHWGIQEEPSGYINRSGIISTIDKWDALVRDAIQRPTPVMMDLTGEFSPAQRTININVLAIANTTLDARLQLWITESGITAQQAMPDGSVNPDYVHNHVFRACVNGTWGTDLHLDEGESHQQTFTYQVPEDWDMNNIHVVAFVYDDTGVLQACEM